MQAEFSNSPQRVGRCAHNALQVRRDLEIHDAASAISWAVIASWQGLEALGRVPWSPPDRCPHTRLAPVALAAQGS